MELCDCCRSSHCDVHVISSPWTSDDPDHLVESFVTELEDCSLNWFDELTESYLNKQENVSILTEGDSTIWSPCPRGGLFSIHDVGTPEVSILSPLDTTIGLSHNRSDHSFEQLGTDQLGIRWTNAMATPKTSYEVSDSHEKIAVTDSSEFKQKRTYRKLFSPVGVSSADDSLLRLLDNTMNDKNITVELEGTLINEGACESILLASVSDQEWHTKENISCGSLTGAVSLADIDEDDSGVSNENTCHQLAQSPHKVEGDDVSASKVDECIFGHESVSQISTSVGTSRELHSAKNQDIQTCSLSESKSLSTRSHIEAVLSAIFISQDSPCQQDLKTVASNLVNSEMGNKQLLVPDMDSFTHELHSPVIINNDNSVKEMSLSVDANNKQKGEVENVDIVYSWEPMVGNKHNSVPALSNVSEVTVSKVAQELEDTEATKEMKRFLRKRQRVSEERCPERKQLSSEEIADVDSMASEVEHEVQSLTKEMASRVRKSVVKSGHEDCSGNAVVLRSILRSSDKLTGLTNKRVRFSSELVSIKDLENTSPVSDKESGSELTDPVVGNANCHVAKVMTIVSGVDAGMRSLISDNKTGLIMTKNDNSSFDGNSWCKDLLFSQSEHVFLKDKAVNKSSDTSSKEKAVNKSSDTSSKEKAVNKSSDTSSKEKAVNKSSDTSSKEKAVNKSSDTSSKEKALNESSDTISIAASQKEDFFYKNQHEDISLSQRSQNVDVVSVNTCSAVLPEELTLSCTDGQSLSLYNFDDSFEVSPTFSSQVLQSSQTKNKHDKAVKCPSTSDEGLSCVPSEHSSVCEKLQEKAEPHNHSYFGQLNCGYQYDLLADGHSHSLGNVSDFSLEDGDDDAVCAAAFQAETIAQQMNLNEQICSEIVFVADDGRQICLMESPACYISSSTVTYHHDLVTTSSCLQSTTLPITTSVLLPSSRHISRLADVSSSVSHQNSVALAIPLTTSASSSMLITSCHISAASAIPLTTSLPSSVLTTSCLISAVSTAPLTTFASSSVLTSSWQTSAASSLPIIASSASSSATAQSSTPPESSHCLVTSPLQSVLLNKKSSDVHPLARVLQNKRKKFVYPSSQQIQKECLNIKLDTSIMVSSKTFSHLLAEPFLDTSTHQDLTTSREKCLDHVPIVEVLSHQGTTDQNIKINFEELKEQPNLDSEPPRKIAKLLGFAKFSDVFETTVNRTVSDASVIVNHLPTPSVVTESQNTIIQVLDEESLLESASTHGTGLLVAEEVIKKTVPRLVESKECASPVSLDVARVKANNKQNDEQFPKELSPTDVQLSTSHPTVDIELQSSPPHIVSPINSAAVPEPCVSECKVEQDLDMSSQMWVQSEFSQLLTAAPVLETETLDWEDRLMLGHCMNIKDKDCSNKAAHHKHQAEGDNTLAFSTSDDHTPGDPGTRSSRCSVAPASPEMSVLQLTKLPDDSMEDQLENILKGFKYQLTSNTKFVTPFVKKVSQDKKEVILHQSLNTSVSTGHHQDVSGNVCTGRHHQDVDEGEGTSLKSGDECGTASVPERSIGGHLSGFVIGMSFCVDVSQDNTVEIKSDDNIQHGFCSESVSVEEHPVVGFSTASGKSIHVSEKARSQALKLIETTLKITEHDGLSNRGSIKSHEPLQAMEGDSSPQPVKSSASKNVLEKLGEFSLLDRRIINECDILIGSQRGTLGSFCENIIPANTKVSMISSHAVNDLICCSAIPGSDPYSKVSYSDTKMIDIEEADIHDKVDHHLDGEYKGSLPFKPQKLIDTGGKEKIQEQDLKERVDHGQKDAVLCKNKQGPETVHNTTHIQRGQGDGKLMDDWEDDSSFRDLVMLMDGNIICDSGNNDTCGGSVICHQQTPSEDIIITHSEESHVVETPSEHFRNVKCLSKDSKSLFNKVGSGRRLSKAKADKSSPVTGEVKCEKISKKSDEIICLNLREEEESSFSNVARVFGSLDSKTSVETHTSTCTSRKVCHGTDSLICDSHNVKKLKTEIPADVVDSAVVSHKQTSSTQMNLKPQKHLIATMKNVSVSTHLSSKMSTSIASVCDSKLALCDWSLSPQMEPDVDHCKTRSQKKPTGFSAASGKSVSASEKALVNARSFLQEAESVPEVVPAFSFGFSTASGKSVSVSEKALQHAKIFMDTEQVVNNDSHVLVGESSESSCKVLQGLRHCTEPFENCESPTSDNVLATFRKLPEVTTTNVSNYKITADISFLETSKSDLFVVSKVPSVTGVACDKFAKLAENKIMEDHCKIDTHADTAITPDISTANSSRTHLSGITSEIPKNFLNASNDVLRTATTEATVLGEPNAVESREDLPGCSWKAAVASAACISLSHSGTAGKGFSSASGLAMSVSEKALRQAQLILEGIDGNGVGDSLSPDLCDALGRNISLPQPLSYTSSSKEYSHISRSGTPHLPFEVKKKSDLGPERVRNSPALQKPTLQSGNRLAVGRQFQTPVRSACEMFQFDRRNTRSKTLSAVISGSSTPESELVIPSVSTSVTKTSFRPPYKKTSYCDSNPISNSSNIITNNTIIQSECLTSKSSFVSPSSLRTPHSQPLHVMGSCEKASALDHLEVKEALELPGQLDNEEENRLLCQDFVVAADGTESREACGHSKELSKSVHQFPDLVISAVDKCPSVIQELKTFQCRIHDATLNTVNSHVLCDTTLEESRMRQDKVIRNKKKERIHPQVGRWLQARRQKERLITFQSLGLTLKTDMTREELMAVGVSGSTLEVSAANAEHFRFNLQYFYPVVEAGLLVGDGAFLIPDKSGYAGAEEFYRAFLTLNGVDPHLVDLSWVENHYRWIVWKLASYEVCFPDHFVGRSLTPETVMLQLKYRYDREVDGCHRSAIKKIVERDDTPHRRLILCVAAVRKLADRQEFSVELTDGWYSIPAQLDSFLVDIVAGKKLRPGNKIVTSGAELIGCSEGCSPLEMKEGTMLKLNGNSTRPAHWHSKLGYSSPTSGLCVAVGSLSPLGGTVSCIDVVVCRKYPVMYMEKFSDGSSIFRTTEDEDKVRQRYEDMRQEQVERIYVSLQKEMENNMPRRKSAGDHKNKKCMKDCSGQDLAAALDEAANPDELQESFSASQMDRLSRYRQAEMDRQQQEMSIRLQEAMAETCNPRNVTAVIKFKVSGCCRSDVDERISCLMVVWQPGMEWSQIEEGRRYKFFNVSTSSKRDRHVTGNVTLTANRQTCIKPCPISENLLDIVYNQREAWSVRELISGNPIGDEFDFVGIVVLVLAATRPSSPTCAFVADKNQDIMSIRLWSSSQGTCLKPGQCFVACNLILTKSLQISGNRSALVTANARSDLTSFTTSGHSNRYSDIFADVQSLNKNSILQDLQAKVNAYTVPSSRDPELHSNMTSRLQDYHEDFSCDLIQQILIPMSQDRLFNHTVGTLSRQKTILDMYKQPRFDISSSLSCEAFGTTVHNFPVVENEICSTESAVNNEHSEKGCPLIADHVQDSFQQRSLSVHAGNFHVKEDNCGKSERDAENLMSSELMARRRSLLRNKMSKLLGYGCPSKLPTIPYNRSPACSREFVSPTVKKI